MLFINHLTPNSRRHGKRELILKRVELGEEVTRSEKSQALNIHHPDLRVALINLFRDMGVQYCVATYEADSELASFLHEGKADIVITRDGDLVLLYAEVVIWEQSIDWHGLDNYSF